MSKYLGISRKHVLFGICLGFGIFTTTNLMVMTSATHHAFFSKPVLSVISAMAYNLAVVIWLVYIAALFPNFLSRGGMGGSVS